MKLKATTSVLALCALAITSAANADNKAPIRLGAFIPVTNSGILGEASQVGVELAVRQINATGGIAGRQIALTIADDQANPTTGVGEANRLLHQVGIEAAVGPTYSQVTLAVLPMLSAAKIPQVNISGASGLTPQRAPFSFSMLPDATVQAKAMVQAVITTFHAKKVAILSDNGAQAKSAVLEIQNVLKDRGIGITGTQEYNYGVKDVTPQLLTLRSAKPDAIMLFTSTGDDTANVLLSRAQLNWDVPVSGSFAVSLAQQALAAGGVKVFNHVTALNYRGFSYCPADGKPQRAIDLVKAVREAKPNAAAKYPMAFLSLYYDAVFVLKAAIESNGGKADGPAFTAWTLANIQKFKGVNSSLNASAQSHFLIGEYALASVRPETIDEYGIQQRSDCSK